MPSQSTVMVAAALKLIVAAFVLLALTAGVYGQDTSSGRQSPSGSGNEPSSSTSSSPSISLSLTTGSVTLIVPTTISGRPTQVTTAVPGVFNVTRTITPPPTSSSAEPLASSSASAEPTPEPIVLDTRVDPAFGVLGVILILTGLPSAFWGHKNRWTSFFLIGFYTLSLVCISLILKFGVLPAINPPSQTLRGMFVLSCTIAGSAGGAIAIFFWKGARYFIGGWGGFALALWIQCFSDGGLVKPIGYRWILYIGCGVIGFALCTIPKIHYHILLVSTALVGATSFMLGVDCFTTAGLKEFYVWNLGFPTLFPKFLDNKMQFPVSQQMQIELGLTAAVALMGMAVQFRILKVLQRKLAEIEEEEKRRDEEAEVQASGRFDEVKREQAEWEREHPNLPKHGRHDSTLSGAPLMREKDREGSLTPTTNDRLSSYMPYEDGGNRPRALSGLSDFNVAPASEEELRRASRYMQNPGVLPTLDLGLGIQDDVPSNFITANRKSTALRSSDVAARVASEMAKSKNELEELKKKEELLAEIQNIRKSIDVLKSETPTSSGDPSRRPSFSSKRTLSVDANHVLVPSGSLTFSHPRPPRATDPQSGNRTRSHSMEFSAITNRLGDLGLPEPINRPTSVPLQDAHWDSYIQERKLLQPPSGVTPPIATSPLPTPRVPMAPAVQEALTKRKQMESNVLIGAESDYRSNSQGSRSDGAEDVPLARISKPRTHQPLPPQLQPVRQNSSGAPSPVTILPPRRSSGPIYAPQPQHQSSSPIVKTFEELNERHREKMRGLQAPLTRAEKEQIELAAAKQRWERNKRLEKEAMERRERDQREKHRRRRSDADDLKKLTADGQQQSRRHSRSMSGDRLGMGPADPSRRLSMLKVEDWQRYQQQEMPRSASALRTAGMGQPVSPSPARRMSIGDAMERQASLGVPFPADGRRKSRDYLS
ncbi:hypothetical protein BKA70DRAFT_314444 [Coprinopsis sp. MPI-PUGE-AT-0042]|nr:hypothetical protein BKA70DRAFT_314444 [Coprinopsis sp. MPI-PUGE-AT-0042]